MTFEEAKVIADEYSFLPGQETFSADTTVVSVIIKKESDGCKVFAFYYPTGSQVNTDPIGLYKCRKNYPPFKTTVEFSGKERKCEIKPVSFDKNCLPTKFLVTFPGFYYTSIKLSDIGWKSNRGGTAKYG